MIVNASSDIGISKSTNQDSVFYERINTPTGEICFCAMADGMGGLSDGEFASSSIVNAFANWLHSADLINLNPDEIQKSWESIVFKQNEYLIKEGEKRNVQIGTTITVLLLTNKNYYVCNVGDTRCYEISDKIKQITIDHSLLSREIQKGNITKEEANLDSRQNILLQCVGVSDDVSPDFFKGDSSEGTKYLLCTDGFRHLVTDDEIFEKINCEKGDSYQEVIDFLIDLNKSRGEEDNISAAIIKNSDTSYLNKIKTGTTKLSGEIKESYA